MTTAFTAFHTPSPLFSTRACSSLIAPRAPLSRSALRSAPRASPSRRFCTIQGSTTPAATSTATPQLETATFCDTRQKAWTFVKETLHAASPRSPLVVLHPPTALGLTRTYWSRYFDFVSNLPSTHVLHRPTVCFDWVCTGDSGPMPTEPPPPFDSDFYAAQVVNVLRKLRAPAVVVAQGQAETIILRVAATHPYLLRGFVVVNGLSTAYITKKPPKWRLNLAYSVLTSPFGDLFFRYCATDAFVRNFSRKNCLLSDTHMDMWVAQSMQGCTKPESRFPVYSFFSGFFFDDYTADMRALRVPMLFLIGSALPASSGKRNLTAFRPPAPIVANETTFADSRSERVSDRLEVVEDCRSVVVEDVGPHMFYENPELGAPHLVNFLTELGA